MPVVSEVGLQGASIVMPCYETGNLLLECVNSIKSHPIKAEYEIIIVDDNSRSSETHSALAKLENESEVTIIHNADNRGQSASRNTGITAAKYDYIFMMDADDLINTDAHILKWGSYIDRAIKILESDADVAFVYSMTRMFGLKNEIRNTVKLSETMILKRYPVPIGLVYRKKDLSYNEPYNQDIEKWTDWAFVVGFLNNRIIESKKTLISFLPYPYYLYRQHSLTNRISTRRACERKMLSQTLNLYPEIFNIHFNGKEEKDIIQSLLINSQYVRGYVPRACDDCGWDPNDECVRNDVWARHEV